MTEEDTLYQPLACIYMCVCVCVCMQANTHTHTSTYNILRCLRAEIIIFLTTESSASVYSDLVESQYTGNYCQLVLIDSEV